MLPHGCQESRNSAVGERLDERGFIVPGPGDAGDRPYGLAD